MRHLLLFCILLSGSTSLSARPDMGTISGKIINADQEPLEFATVLLHRAADSTLVKAEMSDAQGLFSFPEVPADSYYLVISYVGLPTHRTAVFPLREYEQLTLPDIQFAGSTVAMAEVVVSAQRPILEVRPDKLVFNVSNTINASGNTALELLRKAPGIVVDNNENVTLLGRAGVQIWIDGKLSPLRGADLAEFLKSLQADEIESIEIISSPSARFDAAGNAGIINIKLKKDKRQGANGTATLGMGAGIYGNATTGLSANYRNKNINLFGSYNGSMGNWYSLQEIYRNQLGVTFDQLSTNRGRSDNHNFKAGADVFLTEKSTFGILLNGYANDYRSRADSRALIGPTGSTVVDSILLANNTQLGNRNNLNINLNYRFDNGRETILNIDADYGSFFNDGREEQPNRYLDATESILISERNYATQTPTQIDIATLKIDYERPLAGGKLSAGVKTALVGTFNSFSFFNVIDGNRILSTDFSNDFDYQENILAAYTGYARQIKKLGLQAGLRVEHTESTGRLTALRPVNNDLVERSYTDVFPSGGLTYALNDKHNFQLSYSRRINRPSYQDLNPFQERLDELTYEQGNPFLRPEYANTLQLTHTFMQRFNTTISRSHTRDQITRFVDTAGVSGSFITWRNLTDQYANSIVISLPVEVMPGWNSFSNLTGSYVQNKADFGGDKTVDLDIFTFNIYSQQTFSLPKGWNLELSGWYNAPSLWGGTFRMESMWSIDAGIQQKLFRQKINMKISVSDIFRSNQWRGTSTFGVLDMTVGGAFDSRRLRLNLSYNFGNNQVKGARRRNTGIEDEQQRIKQEN
jgi:iron complex outermembrane recepter protein